MAVIAKRNKPIPKLPSSGKKKSDESFEEAAIRRGKRAYNRLFARLLSVRAFETFGAVRAKELLTLFKEHITVTNLEAFLEPLNVNFDIGLEAYKKYSDNIEMFVFYAISLMRMRQSQCCSEIDLTSTLYYFGLIIRNLRSEKKEHSYKLLRMLAVSTLATKPNPFKVGVLTASAKQRLIEKAGFKICWNYRWLLKVFFETLRECEDDIYKRNTKGVVCLPRLYIFVTSRENIRYNQLLKLAKILAYEIDPTIKAFREVPCLSEDSVEMNVALDKVKNLRHLEGIDNSFIINKMKEIENRRALQTFSDFLEIKKDLIESKRESLRIVKDFNLKPEFYEESSFLENTWEHIFNLDIDCGRFRSLRTMTPAIYAAAEILMLRLRGQLVRSTTEDNQEDIDRGYYSLTLTNVKIYTKGFVEEVKKLNSEIRSKYNKNIDIKIKYDSVTAMSLDGEPEPTHVRIISDIHADVNKDRHYIFNFGNDFVINCGDTSGSSWTTREWMRSFMPHGLAVVGNHLGYEQLDATLNSEENLMEWNSIIHPDNTKTSQTRELINMFQFRETKVLSNDWWSKYGIIFIGNTLFTDFKLFGEENKVSCMIEASKRMNDFKRCYMIARRPDSRSLWETRPFKVEDHAKLFRVCTGYINNKLRYMKRHGIDTPVVIVTHHCPLPFCVADQYKNDPLSAAFASDLRWLIDRFPKIRMWCSGHTHVPYDFIYNETRFVCHPWGYFNENNFDIETYGKRIAIQDIQSSKSWREILKDEIAEGSVKDYGFGEGVEELLEHEKINCEEM